MLSQAEKNKILLEETYRTEVRKMLEGKTPERSFFSKVLAFLNSALGLWLLSAIFISGGTKLYEDYKAHIEDQKITTEKIDKLDIEIGYRYSRFLVNLYELTQKDHDSVKLATKYTHEDVKKLTAGLKSSNNATGDFLYSEYSSFGLLALLSEEKKLLSHLDINDDRVGQVINDITGLEVFFEVEKVRYQDIWHLAIVIEEKLILPRWKNNSFYFLDGNPSNPFP